MKKIMMAALLLVAASALALAQKVPAYLDAPYQKASALKSKLKAAGFSVVGTYHPAGHGSQTVLIVTNGKLKAVASKSKRGFAAIQRVMVDSKRKRVRATNPAYWLHAFLQKGYSASVAGSVKAALGKALGKMSPSKDALSAGSLGHYHFMFGMPYYEDMVELGKARSMRNQAFHLSLRNGAKLYGVRLGSVEGFVNKIGSQNALLLPYPVLIEGGKAYALNPKFYIALAYPNLSMGQFMKISSTPDAIIAALKKSLH